MEKTEISTQLNALINEKYGFTEADLLPDNKIKELGLDSLDFVELFMDIETMFKVAIADEVMEKFVTVDDIVEYIYINQKPAA